MAFLCQWMSLDIVQDNAGALQKISGEFLYYGLLCTYEYSILHIFRLTIVSAKRFLILDAMLILYQFCSCF